MFPWTKQNIIPGVQHILLDIFLKRGNFKNKGCHMILKDKVPSQASTDEQPATSVDI